MHQRLEFKAMGARKMLAVLDSPAAAAAQLLEQVPVWFEAWEATLSRFRPESELSRLNRSAGSPFQVSQTLWEVFQAAVEAEQASQGLVTAAVLPALLSAGYERSFDLLPRERLLAPVTGWQAVGSLAEIEVDPVSRTLCLPADLQLDFGGVAKGWAAQQAAQRLAGYGSALVSAGGDLAISADQLNGQKWPIAVDDPFNPGAYLETFRLGGCGVATSGTDYRRWKQGGLWRHHLIDPRTGQPAQTDVVTATVIAPNVLLAEMAAKATLILGSARGLDWIEARPEFAALLVLETGEIYPSQRLEQFLWSTDERETS